MKAIFEQGLLDNLSNLQVEWDRKSVKEKKKSIRPAELPDDGFLKSLYRQLLISAAIPWILAYWLNHLVNPDTFIG